MTTAAALRREVHAVRVALGGLPRLVAPGGRQQAPGDESAEAPVPSPSPVPSPRQAPSPSRSRSPRQPPSQRPSPSPSPSRPRSQPPQPPQQASLPTPTPTPPPDEPEESFAGLASNAGRLLRARLRRLVRLGLPSGPGHLRAALVHCAGWLVVVLLVTAALAWTVWQAAVTYRVSVQGPASESVRLLQVSLENVHQIADLERQRERGAAPVPDGRAPGSTDGGAGGGSGGLKIEGPLLGAIGAGGVLGLGAVAGLVVLRRYRGRLEQELLEPAYDRVGWPEPDADELVPDEVVEPDRFGDDSHAADAEPPASWSDRTEALKAASERLLRPKVATDDSPVVAASERVYERRRAPRIPVALAGELHWKGGVWPLLVDEISRTGLRFLVEGQPVAPESQQALAATDGVSIVFSALGADVTVNGKLAWRRAEEGATLAGLQFMTLTPQAEDAIAALCPEVPED